MKKLIISIFCTLSLTGCYEFAKSPFSDSEMTLLEDSKITKDVMKLMDELQIEESEGSKEIKGVYEISPTIELAEYKNKDGNFTLTMFMKNEHHYMACDIYGLEDEDFLKSLGNVNIQDGTGAWGRKVIDGDVAELKKWAVNYILKGPKICIAIPYIELHP